MGLLTALAFGVALEALYLTPQGERPYFKGTIDTLAYTFAT